MTIRAALKKAAGGCDSALRSCLPVSCTRLHLSHQSTSMRPLHQPLDPGLGRPSNPAVPGEDLDHSTHWLELMVGHLTLALQATVPLPVHPEVGRLCTEFAAAGCAVLTRLLERAVVQPILPGLSHLLAHLSGYTSVLMPCQGTSGHTSRPAASMAATRARAASVASAAGTSTTISSCMSASTLRPPNCAAAR